MNPSINSISLDESIKQLEKSAWNGKGKGEVSPWKQAIIYIARIWCYTSVLHGVKYLAEPRRPNYERYVSDSPEFAIDIT